MDLHDCERKGLIKKTASNIAQVKSILEMSAIKEDVVKEVVLTEKNISVYVGVAYDSLREVAECLCILHGYKVLSHVCIGELLKSLYSSFDLVSFDRVRWIRNSINYYGVAVDLEQGIELIDKIFLLKSVLHAKVQGLFE